MGKTVPAYRMALEFEIEKWKSFKKALTGEEDPEVFEELMDICRSNGMAGGNACNPIIFEPMVMSILLAQQKLQEIECKRNEVVWQRICAQENDPTVLGRPIEAPPETKSKLISQPDNCK